MTFSEAATCTPRCCSEYRFTDIDHLSRVVPVKRARPHFNIAYPCFTFKTPKSTDGFATSFIRPAMFHSTVLLYPKCRLVVAHMCRPPVPQSALRSPAGNRLLNCCVPLRPTSFPFPQCGCASDRQFAGGADASDDRSAAVLRRKHTIRRRPFCIVVCAGRYCRGPFSPKLLAVVMTPQYVFLFFFEADESMPVYYSPCWIPSSAFAPLKTTCCLFPYMYSDKAHSITRS